VNLGVGWGLSAADVEEAIGCSVLQCAAVCCSVLQCVAVCCSVLQCIAVYSSVFAVCLQCVYNVFAVCCRVLALCLGWGLSAADVDEAIGSSVLQCVAVCCSVLQCVAVYSSV